MSEHDPKNEERKDDRVEDLDVPESESEDVKGGVSLNYSKIEFEYRAPKSPAPGQGPDKLQG
jgi:hypothetical protein